MWRHLHLCQKRFLQFSVTLKSASTAVHPTNMYRYLPSSDICMRMSFSYEGYSHMGKGFFMGPSAVMHLFMHSSLKVKSWVLVFGLLALLDSFIFLAILLQICSGTSDPPFYFFSSVFGTGGLTFDSRTLGFRTSCSTHWLHVPRSKCSSSPLTSTNSVSTYELFSHCWLVWTSDWWTATISGQQSGQFIACVDAQLNAVNFCSHLLLMQLITCIWLAEPATATYCLNSCGSSNGVLSFSQDITEICGCRSQVKRKEAVAACRHCLDPCYVDPCWLCAGDSWGARDAVLW